MSAFEHYFYAPHRAARSYLLAKVFLPLVALDAWMLMIGHAGRYGVDGFNVAHFHWLDRIAPLPTSTLYVGVLVLVGLLALSMALGVTHRAAAVALFLLYTYSWAMSMFDSYQHHYFVSAILLCVIFFPGVSAREIHPPPAPPEAPTKKKHKHKHKPKTDAPLLVSAFGYNLLAATVVVLYAYTSIAKMDAQWVDGHTIKRISTAERVAGPLADWFISLGMSPERFWSLFATSVIPLELLIALGYGLAVLQDVTRSKWLRACCAVTFVLAMALHLGAEALGLEIGWFSYYMMLLGTVFLLPGVVVDQLARLVTWPARVIDEQLADLTHAAEEGVSTTLVLMGGAALVLILVGRMLDLPGALQACLLAACVVLACGAWAVARKRSVAARLPMLGTALAGVAMWLAIASSDVRWDFYRFLGGDLRRRDQPEAALEAYERGERYAPPGQTRRDKILELRRQLGR